jgi:membrane-associated phospholipid phosphatase
MKELVLALALLAPLERLDANLQQVVQAHRAGWLERPMRAATEVGKPVVVTSALLGIAVFDLAEGVPLARVALVSAVVVNLVVEGVKRATNRTRPDGDDNRANSSFPSSHAANAFALAVIFARRWRRGAPWFFVAALVVSASRVYLNRHFTSDVVAGAVIGAGLTLVVARRMRWRLEPSPRAPAPARVPPGG